MEENKCIKCGSSHVAVKDIGMGGGGIGNMFDREQKEFQAVTCTNCGYTEIYARKAGNEDEIKKLFFTR